MNAKHTQGDWWIGAIDGPEFDRRPVFSRENKFDTKVCDVHFTGNADETNANARLIAAAPELLESLHGAKAAIIHLNGKTACEKTLQVIDAAIAKAKGEA